MEKEFESVKDFSREKQKEERRKLAEEIRAQRKEYFSRKENLRAELVTLISDAEAKKLQAGEARTQIEVAEQIIEEKSQGFINGLLHRRKLKKLQQEIGQSSLTEESLTQELEELESARLKTETSLEDRSDLATAREKLDAFYGKSEKEWNDYEEDREAGNIKTIMREREVFLAHAFINPTFSPSDENGIMRRDLRWQDKLDLLILEPTLSASAVDAEHQKTFAGVGVLLGDGQVKEASAHDIGSKAIDTKKRTRSGYRRSERMREQIDDALGGEDKGAGWTEFVVENPQIMGIFFELDSEGRLGDIEHRSDANIADVVSAARERNLPLFALKAGKFYEIDPDAALALGIPLEHGETENIGLTKYLKKEKVFPSLDIKKQSLLTSQRASELPVGLSDEQKEAILERFMTDSPFQLRRFPEAQQVASRAEGRSLYNLYQGFDTKQEITDEKKVTIPKHAVANSDPIEVTILKTVPGPTHLEHLVRLDDGSHVIWKENRKKVGDRSRALAGATYHQDRLLSKQDMALRVGQMFITSKEPMQNIEDVIYAIQKSISDLKEWAIGWEGKGSEVYVEQNRIWLKNICASLYGIMEEAESSGNIRIAEIAKKIAEEAMPFEEYQSMVTRRISESGTIKLSREELMGKEK
jgi:hypothetical protein